MNNPEEFEELVQQAKSGNENAFSHLYEYYLTPIFRFVYFRVRSQEDAEDLTQHVFLKAWSALPEFQEEGRSFSAWLYRIARNSTIDYWRKRKDIPLDPTSKTLHNKESKTENPARLAEKGDTARMIREALHILNEDQQTIIELKFIEELSNKEVADVTGKSEGAIRQVQCRALKILRSHFQENNLS